MSSIKSLNFWNMSETYESYDFNSVLYYNVFMKPYTEGRSGRLHTGVSKKKSNFCTRANLAWLPKELLTFDQCYHKGQACKCAVTQFHHQCLYFYVGGSIYDI